MSVLDRKLRRDLWHLRGMVLAISLVLLGGIATFVMARVTHRSLAETRLVYYADQRFAEVFTSLVRAPEPVAERIAALPGVVSLDFGTLDFVSAHHGAIPMSAMESPGQFDHPLVRRAKCETAAAALATMLLLAPILGLMPNATLAAVVIVYSVGLVQPGEFRAIRGVRTMEFGWALVACAGVLLLGTLEGIVVAIIVSMIGLASQTSRPRVSVIGRKRGADVLRPLSPEHPDDETFEGLLIIRPEGRLFFVNADYVREAIRELVAQHAPRVVALDMSRVPDLEYSALQSLIEGQKRLTESGVDVWLAGLNPGVLEMVRHSGLADRLGRERMLFNARAAIERYRGLPPQPGAALATPPV